MSKPMHYENLDDDFRECAYDLMPWPCPAAQAEAEKLAAHRAELYGKDGQK